MDTKLYEVQVLLKLCTLIASGDTPKHSCFVLSMKELADLCQCLSCNRLKAQQVFLKTDEVL